MHDNLQHGVGKYEFSNKSVYTGEW